jgi:alkylation response protein AidB-like acyl-CoA dehydrogenase
MLVDSNVDIEAARWLCYHAAWLLDQGKSPRDASAEIARCKLYACNIASQIALRTVRIMGGYGTIPEYEVVRRLNDSVELFTTAGTQEIMKNTIGRSIIS